MFRNEIDYSCLNISHSGLIEFDFSFFYPLYHGPTLIILSFYQVFREDSTPASFKHPKALSTEP
jgi:hypothetical protein